MAVKKPLFKDTNYNTITHEANSFPGVIRNSKKVLSGWCKFTGSRVQIGRWNTSVYLERKRCVYLG